MIPRASLVALALPALLLVVGTAWRAGHGEDAPSGEARARPAAAGTAAGASECARCHADVHAAWCVSTHALTVREATADVVGPDVRAGAEVAHGPGRTRFARTGEGYLAHTVGADGAVAGFPLTHVVGRTRIEMLLTQLPDGRRQVLPAMREHETGVWFDYTALYFAGPGSDPRVPPAVAPGDPSFWTGPVRSWDAQCSRCHVSGREVVAAPVHGAPRTRERAWGLDCEACHGPGDAHVRHHDGAAEGQDPILKLRELPRRRQVDACLVCHMETEELVPGWHPGEERDLLEFLDPTLLEDPDRVDPAGRPLELVYAGVSFGVSRCAEEGRLTCQSCHDPHGGPPDAPRRSAMRGPPRDDAQCASCHVEIAKAPHAHAHHGASVRCVDCHMPFLTVERGHGAVTDHTIGIPRPDLVSDRVAQDACTWCHVGGRAAPPGAPPLSEAGIRTAWRRWWPDATTPAWLETIAEARRGAYDAPSRLEALLADREAPRFARATAPTLLARFGPLWRERLVAHAADPDSLVRRRVADGLVHASSDAAWRALVLLLDDPSAPVRVHASRAALLAPGRLRDDAAALARVVRELEAQVAWAPDDDLRWERLADARALAGDAAGERDALARLAALDPGRAGLAERRAAVEARLTR